MLTFAGRGAWQLAEKAYEDANLPFWANVIKTTAKRFIKSNKEVENTSEIRLFDSENRKNIKTNLWKRKPSNEDEVTIRNLKWHPFIPYVSQMRHVIQHHEKEDRYPITGLRECNDRIHPESIYCFMKRDQLNRRHKINITENMYKELIAKAKTLCKENFEWIRDADYTNKLAYMASNKNGKGKLSNLIKINSKENGIKAIQEKWSNNGYIQSKQKRIEKLEAIREQGNYDEEELADTPTNLIDRAEKAIIKAKRNAIVFDRWEWDMKEKDWKYYKSNDFL